MASEAVLPNLPLVLRLAFIDSTLESETQMQSKKPLPHQNILIIPHLPPQYLLIKTSA
jgi:hypothetical protein